MLKYIILLTLAHTQPNLPAHPTTPPIQETCRASYYGEGRWHGTHTAIGTRFRPRTDYTAAHRTIPFGTTLIVQRADTGERTWVRINDRGPYAVTRPDGRHVATTPGNKGPGQWRNCIDLSIIAADAISIRDDGMKHVHLRYWATPSTPQRWRSY